MSRIVLKTLILVIVLRIGAETRHIGRYGNGAVVSAAPGCAKVGIEIMRKGGTVIDVAIATALCESVVNPTTMGLGGGFIATVYNRTTRDVWNYNARETAPAAATEDMFIKNPDTGGYGPLNVAVPGELRAYWYLYLQHGGGVSWKSLVKPTITMCFKGIMMTNFTEKMLRTMKKEILADSVLTRYFIDPLTNDIYRAGEMYTMPQLGKTLTTVAYEGGDAIHRGSLTKSFVEDIQKLGGIITEKDMNNFRPKKVKPVHVELSGGKQFYSFPLPSSGPVLAYILNILDGYLDEKTPLSIDNVQKLTEALKFGYGQRSRLGDRDFVDGLDQIVEMIISKEFAEETRRKIYPYKTFENISYYGASFSPEDDHGTANICVWGPNGDGIALTSSINYVLGGRFASKSTGIILNNSMDDFSSPGLSNIFGYPPSPTNYIVPGKRPLSSMCPSIILNDVGDLHMIIGGAGGSKIISSIAQVIANRIFFNMESLEASGNKRLHHQLMPMQVTFEKEWLYEDTEIPRALARIGHNVSFADADGFAALTFINVDETKENSIIGVPDKRRYGGVAYLRDNAGKKYT